MEKFQLSNLDKMLYFEKYVNETYLTSSKYAQEFDNRYISNNDNVYFNLPCYKVPIKDLNIVESTHEIDILSDIMIDKEHVKVFIHPILGNDSEKYFMIDLNKYERISDEIVTSTSSIRTVNIKGKNYFIKLHYPVKTSNFYRGIGENIIKHNLKVSSELQYIKHPKFAILPDILGISFPSKPNKRSWGYMVRSAIPLPYMTNSEKCVLVPGFALYSKYKYHPDNLPYITILIGKSKLSPLKFILQEIMFQIIEYWIYVLVNFGYLIEPHGQNILFEIENDEIIHRLVYRDLDPVVHINTRIKLGLSNDDFKDDITIHKPNDLRPFGSDASVVYDNGFCRLLFEPFTQVMKQYYNINPEQLQKPCREYFKKLLPNYEEYFSKHVYQYKDVDPETHVCPVYITGQKPVWRPE